MVVRRLLAALALAAALAPSASAQELRLPDRVDLTVCMWDLAIPPGASADIPVRVRNPRESPVWARVAPGFEEAGAPDMPYGGWTFESPPEAGLGAFESATWRVVVRAPREGPAPAVHLRLAVSSDMHGWWRPVDGALEAIVISLGTAPTRARGERCLTGGFEEYAPPGRTRDPTASAPDPTSSAGDPAASAGELGAWDLPPPPPDWLGPEEAFFDEPELAAQETRAPPPPPPTLPPSASAGAWIAGAVAVAGAGSAGTALLAWRTDWGRWKLLAPLVGLYSRLAKHRVLEQSTRDKLYALVKERPGIHLVALRDALGLSTTLAVHHLRMLERHGLITSRREGRWRRFFPVGARLGAAAPAPLTELQRRIVQLARERGGVEYGDVVDLLGVSKQRVSYNVKVLSDMGVAKLEKDERGRYVILALAAASA